MWFDETHGKKERILSFRQFLQRIDSVIRNLPIVEDIVSDIGSFSGGAEYEFLRPIVRARIFRLVDFFVNTLRCVDSSFSVVVTRAGAKGGDTPGFRIAKGIRDGSRTAFGENAVIDFSHRAGVIAVILKKLRECNDVRVDVAKVSVVPVNLSCIGPEPRHHRCARRSANCLLAVGAIESNTACCEGIDVRRLGDC